MRISDWSSYVCSSDLASNPAWQDSPRARSRCPANADRYFQHAVSDRGQLDAIATEARFLAVPAIALRAVPQIELAGAIACGPARQVPQRGRDETGVLPPPRPPRGPQGSAEPIGAGTDDPGQITTSTGTH